MPQVIRNKEKWEEAIEELELSRELAKQVFSQLSYTPTEELLFILKHSSIFCCLDSWSF